jgi:hypothetical protein
MLVVFDNKNSSIVDKVEWVRRENERRVKLTTISFKKKKKLTTISDEYIIYIHLDNQVFPNQQYTNKKKIYKMY